MARRVVSIFAAVLLLLASGGCIEAPQAGQLPDSLRRSVARDFPDFQFDRVEDAGGDNKTALMTVRLLDTQSGFRTEASYSQPRADGKPSGPWKLDNPVPPDMSFGGTLPPKTRAFIALFTSRRRSFDVVCGRVMRVSYANAPRGSETYVAFVRPRGILGGLVEGRQETYLYDPASQSWKFWR